MRARCETEPDDGDQGVSRYRFRIWRHGATEPDAWDFEERQVSATSLRRGGLALLAHHVDASFGTVSVTPGP
jgi:hypothetical protein